MSVEQPFVESGQLLRVSSPVILADPEITIVVTAKYPPSAATSDFLAPAGEFLSAVGIGLLVELGADMASWLV